VGRAVDLDTLAITEAPPLVHRYVLPRMNVELLSEQVFLQHSQPTVSPPQ
jgi:hypothetical protein